jgi:hypothetical protein
MASKAIFLISNHFLAFWWLFKWLWSKYFSIFFSFHILISPRHNLPRSCCHVKLKLSSVTVHCSWSWQKIIKIYITTCKNETRKVAKRGRMSIKKIWWIVNVSIKMWLDSTSMSSLDSCNDGSISFGNCRCS